MRNDRNLDDVQRSLQETLHRIEAEVSKLLDEPRDLMDPDRMLAELDEQADGLCQALAALDASLARDDAMEGADLTLLAESSVKRQLDRVTFPVVVRSSWGTGLPQVAVPRESVHSAVDQAVRLAIEFAGHGGEARFGTWRRDDLAVLGVDVSRGEAVDAAAAGAFETRFGSVVEFVGALGGEMRVAAEDETLRFELRLPVGIEVI